jgi:hypothetical protein
MTEFANVLATVLLAGGAILIMTAYTATTVWLSSKPALARTAELAPPFGGL